MKFHKKINIARLKLHKEVENFCQDAIIGHYWSLQPSLSVEPCEFIYSKFELAIIYDSGKTIATFHLTDIDTLSFNPAYMMTVTLKNGNIFKMIK